MPVLFDLDGVLVDNVAFEQKVTARIIEHLAAVRHIAHSAASEIWMQTLRCHQDHPLWHDYGLHCRSLGIGGYERKVHRECLSLLQRLPGIDEALGAARGFGPLWLASDATRWVVDLKLGAVQLRSDLFSHVFSSDYCHAHKGCSEYWQMVRGHLPGPDSPLVFVDNRIDRLATALMHLPQCHGIWVDTADHPSSIGFQDVSLRTHKVQACSHAELAYAIVSACQRALNIIA